MFNKVLNYQKKDCVGHVIIHVTSYAAETPTPTHPHMHYTPQFRSVVQSCCRPRPSVRISQGWSSGSSWLVGRRWHLNHDCVGPRDHACDFLHCRSTHSTPPSYASSHTPVPYAEPHTHTALSILCFSFYQTFNALSHPLVLTLIPLSSVNFNT